MKKINKKSIMQRLDLPLEASCFNSDICISSNKETAIYGCKKILSYSQTEVILSLIDMTVTVSGQNLCLKTFYGKDIRICGRVNDIHIEGREC